MRASCRLALPAQPKEHRGQVGALAVDLLGAGVVYLLGVVLRKRRRPLTMILPGLVEPDAPGTTHLAAPGHGKDAAKSSGRR